MTRRTSPRRRTRPATSPRSSPSSTTSTRTRWCTRSTPTASAPAGATSSGPGTVLPADYDEDFLDNYELGFKSRWAGGKYTLNLTAFKMEWKDYQIEVTDPGPLFAVLVANVGDAEIEGVTLDFSAFLFDSLDIGLNLQLLDPKTKANDPQTRAAAGRPPAVLRGGERRDLGRVHVPRRDRGRKHLRPLPVELHGQFAERPAEPRPGPDDVDDDGDCRK